MGDCSIKPGQDQVIASSFERNASVQNNTEEREKGLWCKKSLKNTMGMKECWTFSLGSYFKQACDELHLTQDISFTHAMHLALSDHVRRFIAVQGSPRGLKRKEAHP
jgi:hypothetical protein